MTNVTAPLDRIASAMNDIQQNASMVLAHSTPNSAEFRLALSAMQMITSFANAVESEKHYAKQKETMQEMNDIFTLKVDR